MHNQGTLLGNEKGCLDISNSNSDLHYFIIPKGLSQEIEFQVNWIYLKRPPFTKLKGVFDLVANG